MILLCFNTILLFGVKRMSTNRYEPHYYDNPNFPILFHYDTAYAWLSFCPHWHENVELLFFTEGEAQILINAESVSAKAGDVVVIPGSAVHSVQSITDTSRYYCLIVEHTFCERCGLNLEEMNLQCCICDIGLQEKYNNIVLEFSKKEKHYQTEILSEVLSLLVYLARNCNISSKTESNELSGRQLAMVKKTFAYIEQHYNEEITTDMLAERVGFSKYYFCHVFKKITAMTPVVYVNYIRCKKAQELLASGVANVSEAAEQSGFYNLSYFTRTYKKYIGMLPSETVAGLR